MEEGGVFAGADADAPVWIIDPLDGTSNFLHGIPHFAISIAVKEERHAEGVSTIGPSWSGCKVAGPAIL